MMAARFRAIYRITGEEKEAAARAADICYEQTVEYPAALLPNDFIRQEVVGRVENLSKVGEAYEAVIEFPLETTGGELTQFLNVIFGNISLKPGIRLQNLELPPSFLREYAGPRFGAAGLRKLLGVPQRPLLCAPLKPLGLSAVELAKNAYQLALGGIDIIKDDHGLANQSYATFSERVSRCAAAVLQANRETGQNCLYVANVTAGAAEIYPRALAAKAAGTAGLMLAPGITGFDTMKTLAADETIALPIFTHPAFQGSFVVNPQSGIAPGVIFGQLARLAGADATIFPNWGGRFSFSQAECQDIVAGCRVKMGGVKQIFPCPGGGMSLTRVPEMRQAYGADVIFLIGGALFTGDLRENCRQFHALVE